MTPRSILITGASSGIGAALALAYAAQGMTLFLTGRDRDRLEAVAGACREKGALVETASLDVLDRAGLASWIKGTDQRVPLDLVIANAGISGGPAKGCADPEWLTLERRIFDVNVTGTLNTLEPVIPRMIARGRGQLALMSSLAGFAGWSGAPGYSASKGAMRLYGEALGGALHKHGIGVSVICPGFIRSPMTAVNPFPMPFLMDADRAASIIVRGLSRRAPRIAFPWPTYLLAGAAGLMPGWLLAFSGRFAPAKPAGPQS